MAEETTLSASSPAEVEDVFQGQNVSFDEMNRYRQDGEIPARFKPAEEESESASDDAPEETAESETESESETEEAQEQAPKGNSAEKRIKQLLAKTKELERQLATKQDVKTEPSPAQPQYAHPKPTADDKNADGTPKYEVYEDFTEALGRWAAKEERVSWERDQAQQQALSALKTTMDEARSRYDDADEVIFPASQAIQDAKIPLAVKEVFAQSENFIDLCYVVGSDPDELKKFISLAQSNPRAAIGKVFEYERGIQEELSKKPGEKATPEKKQTTAPKPPATVNGASSRAFDVSDESLSPEEWARKRTADLARKKA